MKKHERSERNREYDDVLNTIHSNFATKIFSLLFKLDVIREEIVETGNHSTKRYITFGSRYDWFLEKYCEINHLMWK